MPVEMRKWWIEEKNRENESKNSGGSTSASQSNPQPISNKLNKFKEINDKLSKASPKPL